MLGIYLIAAPDDVPVPEGLRSSLSESSREYSCPCEDFSPAPGFWSRHVSRKVTDAPPAAVSSTSDRVRVVLHGEVFNCADLAQGLGGWPSERRGIAAGPEIAAAGLERHGEEFVSRLNGSFVLLACWANERRFVIANDRYGLRPHYWTMHEGSLLVAPTVRALLAAAGARHRIDKEALAQFFAFDNPTGNRTLVEGIEVFPPGVSATLGSGALRCKRYWDFPCPTQVRRGSDQDLTAELADVLVRAVDRRVETTTALGIPLSGGLDSRVLAAGAARSGAKFEAFTFGNPQGLDRKLASRVADALGVVHHTVFTMLDPTSREVRDTVDALDGMSMFRHYHALTMLPLLAGRVGVVLDGLGGATISGSSIFPSHLHGAPDPGLPRRLLVDRFSNRHMTPEILAAWGVCPDAVSAERSLLSQIEQTADRYRLASRANCADYVLLTDWHRRYHLAGNTLLRGLVEVRTPLFDYDVMDCIYSLPPALRYRRRAYYMALCHMAPALGQIGATPHGIPPAFRGVRRNLATSAIRGWRLGRRVVRKLTRARGPLYPTHHVALSEIPEFVETRLEHASSNSGRILRMDPIRRLWQEHRAGTADHDWKLSSWLTFDLWYENHAHQLGEG